MSVPHLLVIDGSPTARYRLRLELRRHGAEVTTAASAEAALDLLGDSQPRPTPDAVLAHRVLPGMNGLELLELLRTDPRTASVPVVITGVDERWPLRRVALDRGAAALLRPEPDAADLQALLGRLGDGGAGATRRLAARTGPPAAGAGSPQFHGWSIGPGDGGAADGPADGPDHGLADGLGGDLGRGGAASGERLGRHLPFALVVTMAGAALLALLLSHP